jgi:hypothetical protein
MTPSWIEPAIFRFVAQNFNHCATADLHSVDYTYAPAQYFFQILQNKTEIAKAAGPYILHNISVATNL